ncbi:MAG: hypothetical protein M1820_006131 [Bogoriella megaspora]|nr:MAG: hypothetical protein M1820_006131 [Bogoriella megaspora]
MDDNSIDITYNLVRTLVWSCVEFNLGIVCICVALFRPLLYVFLWGTVHPEPDAILFPWAKPGRLRQNPRGHMATYQRVNDAKMAVASVAIVGRPVKARTVQDAKGIRRTTDIDVTIQEGEDDVNWMGKWNASWKDLGADARL